ncbi:hypothetical protein L2Y96_03410 [Luteibacter aegosomaticola]|uniref:hypothetical protein n=1 Tax=Luteibacter aegosomaticola TaxID=2911538 RepID=UPI001FFC26EF|nr:hypothetical protein [Luteibacter aegosomaticola]UPG90835.1 hypothetical protein L2Y96_03410 [Luteibacter aegosomaticola]
MNMRFVGFLLAVAAAALAPMRASGKDALQPMSLSEFMVGAVALIPASSAASDAFFHSHSEATWSDRSGWQRVPFSYRTRDGYVLTVHLVSDWENAKAPDVVRVFATIAASQCMDAGKLHDDLARDHGIPWTPIGSDQGWIASYNGKYLAISRSGRCVVSVAADVRLQPRVAPPTRALRIDASGRVVPANRPGH